MQRKQVFERGILVLVALMSAIAVRGDEPAEKPEKKEEPSPVTPAEQLEALRKKFGDQLEKDQEEIDDLTAKLSEAMKRRTKSGEEYVAQLLALAKQTPGDAVALEALSHVLRSGVDFLGEEQGNEVFELLTKHHAEDARIAPFCEIAAELELTDSAREFLTTVVAKNKTSEAKAWALYALGADRYRAADEANDLKLFQAAEQFFTRCVKEVPADATEGSPVDAAERYLFELRNLLPGKKAPDFDSQDLAGKAVKLSQTRGKVTLLVFWATWCEFCQAFQPQQTELAEQYRRRPLTMINVSGDDDAQLVSEHLAEHPVPGQHWWNGPEGGVVDAWNVQAFPTVYLIDADGVIRYRNLHDEELDKAIEKLVAEAEAKQKSTPKPKTK